MDHDEFTTETAHLETNNNESNHVQDDASKSSGEIDYTSDFIDTHYTHFTSDSESFLTNNQANSDVQEDREFSNDISIFNTAPPHDIANVSNDKQNNINSTKENTDLNFEQQNKSLSIFSSDTQIFAKEEPHASQEKDVDNKKNFHKQLNRLEYKAADEKTKVSKNMQSLDIIHQHSDKSNDKDVTGVDHDNSNLDSDINIRPQTTSTIQDVPGGLRAKPNTPASHSLYVKHDTFKSGVYSPSSDRLVQSMSTLRSSRSSGGGYWDEEELYSDLELRYGVQTPHYFLVHQNKPSPMPPLPVWRGYKGNVYFQPIHITKLNCGPQYPASDLKSQRLSSRSYRLIESPNQVYVLDKQAVVSSVSHRQLQDELKSIEGAESTGSLAVRPDSATAPKKHMTSRASSSKSGLIASSNNSNAQPKIRKGSNFHSSKSSPGLHGGRTHSAPSQSKQFYLGSSKSNRPATTSRSLPDPKLVVSGGKLSTRGYYYSSVRSPTATVLSFSTQKARVNTPDTSAALEKFPALERLSSVDLDIQEEEHSFRNETHSSRASNHSEENRATPRIYTPKVQVRRLVMK